MLEPESEARILGHLLKCFGPADAAARLARLKAAWPFFENESRRPRSTTMARERLHYLEALTRVANETMSSALELRDLQRAKPLSLITWGTATDNPIFLGAGWQATPVEDVVDDEFLGRLRALQTAADLFRKMEQESGRGARPKVWRDELIAMVRGFYSDPADTHPGSHFVETVVIAIEELQEDPPMNMSEVIAGALGRRERDATRVVGAMSDYIGKIPVQ